MKFKEISLPETKEKRLARAKRLQRSNAAIGGLSFAVAILAVLSLAGALVCMIVEEWKGGVPLGLLLGFCGGALGGALAGALLGYLAMARRKTVEDYLERMDSEESFFVGDGTFATFREDGLDIHSEKRSVRIPYGELRAFSVCTRKSPRESGEWSIVLEIPSSYLSQEESGVSLVQADDKPRLRAVLARRGIAVLGEPSDGKKGKFKCEKAFYLPNKQKRAGAVFWTVLGALVAVGGVFVGIFWNAAAGGIMGALGVFLLARGIYAFIGARALFAIYEEGIYWRGSQTERVFLKWEEIVRVAAEEKNGFPLLFVQCECGGYRFPRPQGALEAIAEKHPEKSAGGAKQS